MFYFLAHYNDNLPHSRVSFSQHESHSLIEFFRKILKEIEDSPNKTIPFFKDKEEKLLEQNKKNNHQAFWSQPDFKLETMRVRINTCLVTGDYIFHLNHPASEEQMAENKGWAGSTIKCKLNDIIKLVKFLVKKNEEYVPESEDEDDEDESESEDEKGNSQEEK
jgi:hypothetical protein